MKVEHPNPIRKELLEVIVRLSNKYPSLRVMQLLGNAVPSSELSRRSNDLYYLADDALLDYLKRMEETLDRDAEVAIGELIANAGRRAGRKSLL